MYKKIIMITLVFTTFITRVNANTLNRIDMDIYLNNDGSASFKEVWTGYFDTDTEIYRSFSNLEDKTISNFSVIDGNNRQFDSVDNWNTSASFTDKAYKSGINNKYNGLELCWGISEYGNRSYTIKYTISNFVTKYTDNQGIYFKLIAKSNLNIDNVNVVVHSYIPISLENARIWAFGYNGNISFSNGNIVINNNKPITESQYITLLVRFNDDIFNTSSVSKKSFDDIYNSAFNDVKRENIIYKKSKIEKAWDTIKNILLIIGVICLNPISLYLIYNKYFSKNVGEEFEEKYPNKLNFGDTGRKLPNNNIIDYSREIPCNNDLEKTFWLSLFYEIVDYDKLRQGIIGAIFLKWLKNNYIIITESNKGTISMQDNNYLLDFSNMTHADNELEEVLFRIILLACDDNKRLNPNDFTKYCEDHYGAINLWFGKIVNNIQKQLEEQGIIKVSTNINDIKSGIKNVDPSLKTEATKVKGFKKYLEDFSLMHQKEHFDVRLWEDYLIFAELLGIADKVSEQFNKLYPDYNSMTRINTKVTTHAIDNLASMGYQGFMVGLSREIQNKENDNDSFFNNEYNGNIRDTGGGGSSYTSGGSSAGGSSGMGTR